MNNQHRQGQNVQMQGVQRNKINYVQKLMVYPASFVFRQDIDNGDKILLPQSLLKNLYQFMSHNHGPLIFCITNDQLINPKRTYCGVLEFVADEGLCFVPNWMFKMLKFAQQGQYAQIALVPEMRNRRDVRQKQPSYIKLRPHKTKFIQLPNPKAILEYQLRNFTCLHEGDTITITVFKQKYEIDILEIKPSNPFNAICIIDVDIQVDFAPPLDYQEIVPQENIGKFVQKNNNNVFDGKGVRIDQKLTDNKGKDKDKNVNRKGSTVPEVQQEEYDPRKHRIHRGVRKPEIKWTGVSEKIGVPEGTKRYK